MATPLHFSVEVESVERHTPDVATFHLAWRDRRPRFRPGQFVQVALDRYDPGSHWPESRPFSIASAPGDPHGMRLTISRQGPFTGRMLAEATPGRRLSCKGPYGDFVIGEGVRGHRIILIAGGTGITPFCAFLEASLVGPSVAPAPATLYYGARTPELLVYRALAERWAGSVRGAETHLWSEREAAGGIAAGRLDIALIAGRENPVGPCCYFLSGPSSMIVGFRDRLEGQFQVPSSLIRVDHWQ